MLNTLRLFFAFIILALISPQTQKYNIVLQIFHESGFFIDYGEAEWFLKVVTWFSIISFLIISII